jgi:putative transposase
MFGTHRAIYNKLVEESKDDCYKLSKKDLAEKYRGISQKHSISKYLPDFHLEVPEEVMNSTYRDFTKAIQASRELYKSLKSKNEKTTFPSLKFKSRKDNSSSIEIQSRSIFTSEKFIRVFPKYFGFDKVQGIAVKQSIPDLHYSVRIQKTKNDNYYICIPRYIDFVHTDSRRVCAIDPGVRSFISIYDPHGLAFSIDDVNDVIFKKCLNIDFLKSIKSKERSKRKRNRLSKKIYNLFQRIKSMISDMHHKISRWMSDNYNEVLLPSFETSQMTSKQKRISSKTSRAMLTWSHYKFKELLRYKMERSGGRVIDCKEYYTTKTCSCCGRINHNIKAEKTYECVNCKHVLNRDLNAARNIYLMNEYLLTWTNRVQVMSKKPTSRLSVLNQEIV